MLKQPLKNYSFLIKGDIEVIYFGSCITAFLMATASITGLVFTGRLYPTDELKKSFLVNDAINLFIGLPILLGSIWAARRGKLAGMLLWPGALLFIIYNYLIYTFSMPINAFYMIYLVIVLLSLFLVVRLINQFDGIAVKELLIRKTAENFGGVVLMLLGLVFAGRASTLIFSERYMPATILALNLSDIILSISWIVAGFLLLRRKEIGYLLGLGMLFQGSMLFIGLIALMVVQPTMDGSPILFGEIIQVAVMGLIVFIPFYLFLRGVISADAPRMPLHE